MTAVPRFKRGVKFRFDTVRNVWIILAPEKLFMPDDIAVEILRLVDGARTTDHIVDDLARRFDAPRETIADDVVAALDDLSLRGAIQL
ncbi:MULTISPECIES: pyrroloquinoline quinone biosynthesis peptide chaperone PqqD [Sphingomonas]|jgi:pyrroloquinoline quinone biosynthesis protein D|uniref:Pyrroloquinoline quinone biosynthesis protein PqqD n=1 Tax=Sphingomonas aurantiaca TaxID=185949 RepID=A0A5E8AAD1_9SPHN|nr:MULTISPECIES: pyrroloquinoline quinone biosynthesis peptide chaperone PqqD [Sphingomonas]KQM68905.1 pyrroloquinoline quinone biosynthesis protein PqqD [Sphingomonas sp. Leaf20]KQM90115.1 pyrroloquinoline quinone biosynthesis protein PqqD [Sphingomonas sp. Leaf226]MBD8472287.1 pyrroloquinoline quinone biosynthesis peptide chaperone PqqD [Sphingomonas sp. CFBP 8765]MCK8458191.1 pyrroloquinoline quinone biosynthesis peptide chaperone PqqD [Sphingomonas faeni]VVT28145.1 Pyrroloquinoline quinone